MYVILALITCLLGSITMQYDSSNKTGYWLVVAFTVFCFISPLFFGKGPIEHMMYAVILIPLGLLCNSAIAKKYLLDRTGLTIYMFLGKKTLKFDQIIFVKITTAEKIAPRVVVNKSLPIIMIEVKKHNLRYCIYVNDPEDFLTQLRKHIDIESINEKWNRTIGEQY